MIDKELEQAVINLEQTVKELVNMIKSNKDKKALAEKIAKLKLLGNPSISNAEFLKRVKRGIYGQN